MVALVDVTEEERHWLLNNIARGFTDYLKVSWPPVWVELIPRLAAVELLPNDPETLEAIKAQAPR